MQRLRNRGGGGNDTSIKVEEEDDNFDGIRATSAGAYYPGDQWGTGSDNILLALMTGEAVTYRVEDTYGASYLLAGEGKALWLDLNAPLDSGEQLPAGTYSALLEDPAEGESQDFTFLPGVDMGAWGITGSFVYTLEEGAAAAQYAMVEDGTVTIEVENGSYTVLASVIVDGQNYDFKYVGAIADAKDNPVPPTAGGDDGDDEQEEYAEIVVTGLTQGEMDYYGLDAYGSSGTPYTNWEIYLAGNNFDFDTFEGDELYIQLEINAPADATTAIAPGTYEIIAPDDFILSAVLPYTAVPGGINSSNYLTGTWYTNDATQAQYGATSGTITISAEGDDYTIAFDFVDKEYKSKISGSYTGPLGFYDGTAGSDSGDSVTTSSLRKTAAAKVVRAPKRTRRPVFRK